MKPVIVGFETWIKFIKFGQGSLEVRPTIPMRPMIVWIAFIINHQNKAKILFNLSFFSFIVLLVNFREELDVLGMLKLHYLMNIFFGGFKRIVRSSCKLNAYFKRTLI